MGLALNKEQLDASIGALKATTNENILAHFEVIANILKDERGQNAITDQVFDACRKFQEQYNNYVPGVHKLIEEFGSVIDIAEYLEKSADMGTVGSHDTGFVTEGIDAEAAKL